MASIEDGINSLKHFKANSSLNDQQKHFLDSYFMEVMYFFLIEEDVFFLKMYHGWGDTRTRFIGLLSGLTFAFVMMCIGRALIIGLCGLLTVLIVRIKLKKSHDNSLSTKPPYFKSYVTDPNVKQNMLEQDRDVFKWLNDQIVYGQGNYYSLIKLKDFPEELYFSSRLLIDYCKERTNKMRENLWHIIWPSGELPHFVTKKLNKQISYLEDLEKYLEKYRLIRLPHMAPHNPVYDN